MAAVGSETTYWLAAWRWVEIRAAPIGSSVSFPAAASANRASAGTDFDPVFFMIEARWFSTVRWLIPKIRGDILAGVSGEHQLHDLVLTRREPRDIVRRILPPGG